MLCAEIISRVLCENKKELKLAALRNHSTTGKENISTCGLMCVHVSSLVRI